MNLPFPLLLHLYFSWIKVNTVNSWVSPLSLQNDWNLTSSIHELHRDVPLNAWSSTGLTYAEKCHPCFPWGPFSSALILESAHGIVLDLVQLHPKQVFAQHASGDQSGPMLKALLFHPLHTWACRQRNPNHELTFGNFRKLLLSDSVPLPWKLLNSAKTLAWHNYESIDIWVKAQKTLMRKTMSSSQEQPGDTCSRLHSLHRSESEISMTSSLRQLRGGGYLSPSHMLTAESMWPLKQWARLPKEQN